MDTPYNEQILDNLFVPSTSKIGEQFDASKNNGINSIKNSISDGELDSASEQSTDDGQDGTIDNVREVYSGGNKRLRQLPSRRTKTNLDSSRDLRISMKAKNRSSGKSGKLSPAKIEKLYCKQKLTKFHPTKLETIFEEPQPIRSRSSNENSDGGGSQIRWIGHTKLKRSLSLNDGYNISKKLKKHRRAMIKKKLGRRRTSNKMPFKEFVEYMQTAVNLDSEKEDNELQMQEAEVSNKNPKEDTPIELKKTEIKEEEI